MDNQPAMGQLIKRYRIARGMSQDELAKRIGLTASAISKFEKGLMSPKSSVQYSLCYALDISYSELVLGISVDELWSEIEWIANEIGHYQNSPIPLTVEEHKKLEELQSAYKERENLRVMCFYAEEEKRKLFEREKEIQSLPWEDMAWKKEEVSAIVLPYMKLNTLGKKEAVKRVEELAEISKYTIKDGE